MSDMLGQPVRTPAIPVRTGAGLRAAYPDVVYTRPFKTLYASLGEGRTFEQAMDDATRRLEHLATTDLQLSKPHTARALHGGRRPRPVLPAGAEGFGLVRAVRRGLDAALPQGRPAADPSGLRLRGRADPGRPGAGQVINKIRVENVHEAIAKTFGAADRDERDPIDYREVLAEREQGETGPMLARAGDRFTGSAQVGGSTATPPPSTGGAGLPSAARGEGERGQDAEGDHTMTHA